MGKIKIFESEDKRVYESPEIPKKPNELFEYIDRKLNGKKFKSDTLGSALTITEVGPKTDLGSTYQMIGLVNASYKFTIRLVIGSQFEAYLKGVLETEQAMAKKLMLASQFYYWSDAAEVFRKVLIKAIEKSKKPPKEKKPKEEKEKKPKDPLKLLKLQFVEGKISEEEYFQKKKILEE